MFNVFMFYCLLPQANQPTKNPTNVRFLHKCKTISLASLTMLFKKHIAGYGRQCLINYKSGCACADRTSVLVKCLDMFKVVSVVTQVKHTST